VCRCRPTFLLSNDKRTAIEFALEHLARHAPAHPEVIALAAGAPFGEIVVDKANAPCAWPVSAHVRRRR
jgi:hypothetical protein